MKKYIVEGIGTFFILLAVALATGPLAPIAIGGMLVVLIIAAYNTSGAHFNPAVSLAQLMRGRLSNDVFPMYVVAQMAGAALAGLICAWLVVPSKELPVPMSEPFKGVVAEFLGTFVLVFSMLQVLSKSDTNQRFLYGATAGIALLVCGILFASTSGGLVNPAVAFGLAIQGKMAWSDLWIFLTGDLLGAAAAATAAIQIGSDE